MKFHIRGSLFWYPSNGEHFWQNLNVHPFHPRLTSLTMNNKYEKWKSLNVRSKFENGHNLLQKMFVIPLPLSMDLPCHRSVINVYTLCVQVAAVAVDLPSSQLFGNDYFSGAVWSTMLQELEPEAVALLKHYSIRDIISKV